MSQLQLQLFRTCLARTEPNEPLPYYRLGRTAIDRKRTRTSRCPSAEAPRRPSVTTTRPWARVCWAWNSTSPGSTSNSEVRRRNSCRELNELCGLQRTPPRPSTALWRCRRRTTRHSSTPSETATTIRCTSMTCPFGVGINHLHENSLSSGMIGETDNTQTPAVYRLYTHKKLEIGYNEKQIVDVNLTSDGRVDIEPGKVLEFSYEVWKLKVKIRLKWICSGFQVVWKPSSILFQDRFDKYLDPSFFQHRIHWFSIFNSFMMVVFLVGLVWMILVRTLRKDYARYHKDDNLDDLVDFHFQKRNWKMRMNCSGRRSGGIWLEASARRCIPPPAVASALLLRDWSRLPRLHCRCHYCRSRHCRRILHRVSRVPNEIHFSIS